MIAKLIAKLRSKVDSKRSKVEKQMWIGADLDAIFVAQSQLVAIIAHAVLNSVQGVEAAEAAEAAGAEAAGAEAAEHLPSNRTKKKTARRAGGRANMMTCQRAAGPF